MGCKDITNYDFLAHLLLQDGQGELFEPVLEDASIKPAALGSIISCALWPSPGPALVQIQGLLHHIRGHHHPLGRGAEHGGHNRLSGVHDPLCIFGALLEHGLTGAGVITKVFFNRTYRLFLNTVHYYKIWKNTVIMKYKYIRRCVNLLLERVIVG